MMAFIAIAVTLAGFNAAGQSKPSTSTATPVTKDCGSCHAEIVKSYSQTVMAHASGPISEGIKTGEFTHMASGVHYRITQKDGKAWMEFQRQDDPLLKGKRQLTYFIGSGRKGKSFLFSTNGFLFETPINWYSQEQRWNMAPAYTEDTSMPLNLPALPECLDCHTSGMHAPEKGTENLYPDPPFEHGGITCSRCHGDGEAHANGQGSIINPAKLAPERRDEICMQCHFEGTVAIEQPDRHLYEFRPGEKLSDYIHYFVLNEPIAANPRAVSQFEALWSSVCKQKSGDKMTCTSCHDPHFEPSQKEKVAYFRGKCLACHGEAFGKKHHPEKSDCTQCHMPQLSSAVVAHTQATDHRILRNPNAPALLTPPKQPKLVSFPAYVEPTTRDLALAWETLAQRKLPGAEQEAARNIKEALQSNGNDSALLASAAFDQQEHGHLPEAQELYERALKLNPLSIDAAANLGAIKARSGHLREAVQLWQQAFKRAPHRSAIGMNLAIAFCAAARPKEARDYILQVLAFNPDFRPAKEFLQDLNSKSSKCAVKP